MSTTSYRFFGGLLDAQAAWLNRKAQSGYRLAGTGRLSYRFEPCAPGQYEYQVEFVAQKSRQEADDYARFLEECGYRVLPKNINLNVALGRAKWRPWADSPLRFATRGTTLDRELFIVEKERDGRPFELHTTLEDKAAYCRAKRRPWLFTFVAFAAAAVCLRSPAPGIFAACTLPPLACYGRELAMLKKQAGIYGG